MATGFKLDDLHRMLVWRFLGELAEKAAAALPAAGTNDELFSITGGRILLTGLLGEVTSVIQTQVNNTKVIFNPTVTGSAVDLCATLDISANAVGTLYSISGVVTDAMLSGLSLAGVMTAPVILQPGGIELDTGATNTGSVKWKMWYLPLDDAARVAAV